MAEEHVKATKYKYNLNASLVQSQKPPTGQQQDIGDGSGASLAGRAYLKEGFGTKVVHSKPEELQQKAYTKLQQQKHAHKPSQSGQDTILQATIEQLVYVPRTRETRLVYESLLSLVGRVMGDQPLDVVKGALDEAIQCIKEAPNKAEVEALIGKVSDTDFSALTVGCQQLVDYQPVSNEQDQNAEQEVNVDPELNFSQSEESDFEDVFQVKEPEPEKLPEAVNEQEEDLASQISAVVQEHFGQSTESTEITKACYNLFQQRLSIKETEKTLLTLVGKRKFAFVRDVLKLNRDSKPSQTAFPWLDTAQQITIDLQKLAFTEGPRLMANKRCHLPRGSTKETKPGYDQITVPAPAKQTKSTRLVDIHKEMPQWTHAAFPPEMPTLNVVQSCLYESAFLAGDNLLVCAPTGAGKTNIALLTILQCMNSRRGKGGKIDLQGFKIVYIAPMKALVSEVVGNFQKRLQSYGIKVRELTGDSHLTRQQIDETQIIVTTPEKWDIVTRKSGERAYTDLVKLVIIDEVHLLHDLRGPVLEAIVARTIRQVEQTSEAIRIVALSATLPNYQDVATFLRVPQKSLFYFDSSYRPVPLEQLYIGITEKKAIKRLILMNEILYEKVSERVGKHQVLVFCHSRKETAKTAKLLRDIAVQQQHLDRFVTSQNSKELLQAQQELCESQDLKDVLPFGIGIHHAGLSKKDRLLVEDLFAAGYLQVLCSTATLAWGVNLPAHTVILKGTQIYSPEKGKWVELSPQDVLQMMGRAGRPQYDTVGEGIIITQHSEMQYYLSMNNMQLPIESQMIAQLADQLSAEIVMGTVSNVNEAVDWLQYTYLYVRMVRNPQLYGITSVSDQDPTLRVKRQELVYAAAMLLQKSHLIKFDRQSGQLQSTALGKIAAYYYIKCESMQVYAENMKPHMNSIDLFRLFSLSKEFQNIPIRENEKAELIKFVERVPIPVKGSLDEPSTKINVLLQAYISRFKMEGYDINSDMVYVSQNAGRIMRALFEISLKKGWSQLTEQLLKLSKICEQRLWNSMTPLRQFSQMPQSDEVCRKLEKKAQFQWHHFFEMSAQQLGEVVGIPKLGKTIQAYVNKFPRLQLDAYVQPMTRSTIRVELNLKMHENFAWDPKYHGTAEPFWILIHDSDNETILHSEQFVLKQHTCMNEHRLSFTVALHEPMPPQYFVKVISDRWMHSQTALPISFKHLVLPERFPQPTQVQDLKPKSLRALNFADVEQMYASRMEYFNPIQTQCFETVYNTRKSVFIGAPSGCDKQVLAELAIFKELQDEEGGKALYIAPKDLLCQNVYDDWKERLGGLGLTVVKLNRELPFSQIAAQIAEADVIVATAKDFEAVSRRWRQRKALHQISVYVFDYLQLLSPDYEVVVSRVRIMQNELKTSIVQGRTKPFEIRLVGTACSIANGKDLASWMGVTNDSYFNFAPSTRPYQLDASILSFDQFNRAMRIQTMAKPTFNQIKRLEQGSKAVVFVSDRKQTRLTALDYVTFVSGLTEQSKMFVGGEINKSHFSERTLQSCLDYGIGFIHDGMTSREIFHVKQMFKQGAIRLIIVQESFCWDVAELQCNLVAVVDAQRYDGKERRYVEYDIPTILLMQSLATLSGQNQAPRFLMMIYTPHREFFVKFLQESLPLESALPDNLHDYLNAEIASGNITNKQEAVDWLTWTFMFRRLAPNPNFYNLAGRSPQNINDFVSQLIEDTVEDLIESKCITVDEETEMDLMPDNLGRIAAFYDVQYQTIGLYAKHLDDEGYKIKQLLQVLSQSAEYGQIPIRDGDEAVLYTIARDQNYPQPGQAELNTAPHKTSILLQAHFDRRSLPVDLALDQRAILQMVVKLLHAMTDVISTNGHLHPTLQCMELSQMCVQAMWPRQSPLLQLPGFDQDLVDELAKVSVKDISDFLNMDDDVREKILQIPDSQMQQLAEVCNRYPIVELDFSQTIDSDNNCVLDVKLTRADDDEESLKAFDQPIYAQYFPAKRHEEWWVIVGHPKSGKLLSIKKVTNFRATQEMLVQLKFTVTEARDLRIYLVCDSYVGADLQVDFKVQA